MLMLFFICLMTITSLTHTADDVLPSLEQIKLKEPETPHEFMQQLKRAEARMQLPIDENDPFQLFGKKHSTILSYYNENYQQESLLAIKTFMQNIGCTEFYDYLIALASSPLPNKADDIFVKIPFFKKLVYKEVADAEFDYYNELENEPIYYPIKRLLLAAFLGTPINLNRRYTYGYLSHPVLNADDIELLKKLLRHGLDANIDESLSDCKSMQAAQLLLMHGANFDKQHKEYDLVKHQCDLMGSDNNSSVLALFLPYVSLDKINAYGKKWFKSLVRYSKWHTTETLIAKTTILLQYGCHYDQEQVDALLKIIDKRSKSTDKICHAAHVSHLFKQEERSRKNVVLGLHQRALTSKPLHFKRAVQTDF